MTWDLFIGIDYSGAETPESRLKTLQMFAAQPGKEPEAVCPPPSPGHACRNWSRLTMTHWLRDHLTSQQRLFVGIDHGFSFPEAYFHRYHLKNWHEFLDDFVRYRPTRESGCPVDALLDGVWWNPGQEPSGERTGTAEELRLCEKWTSSATSVFRMHGPGCVGKSTHAGLPWVRFLREECGERLHFWPFDGWVPEEGKNVIAEMYPSIFRRRYPKKTRTGDQQDAYAIARWLQETASRGSLDHYFQVPLSLSEKRTAALEGWILGVT
ncbi:MAG: hypothetical protein HQL73_06215 [Magnetococcales bacterium]|nr:hypothetical protein [Magnetococcales bacterium]